MHRLHLIDTLFRVISVDTLYNNDMKLTNKTTTYTLLILLWLSITAVITLNDQSLSAYLRATPFGVSVFMEIIGLVPLYLLGAVSGMILYYELEQRWIGRLMMIISYILCVATVITVSFYISEAWINKPSLIWAGIAGSILLLILLVQFIAKQLCANSEIETLKNAMIAIVSIIVVMIVIESLKQFGGRVRPYDATSASMFTPWYMFNLSGAGKSFPSAHAAYSMMAFGFAGFFPTRSLRKKMVMIAAILLCAAVSLSRVNLGAHYLSDVWFGASISLFLQVLVIHLLGKRMVMQARFSKALRREMFK